MEKTKIAVEATVTAAPEKAWKFWTKPEHITKWNFASGDWHCPHAENDLRVGGKLKSRMEARDGSVGFDFEATYDEIVSQKKITYTMADGRKATTNFEGVGSSTRITTVFEAENENSVEMQKGGWQAILDNFKKYIEAN